MLVRSAQIGQPAERRPEAGQRDGVTAHWVSIGVIKSSGTRQWRRLHNTVGVFNDTELYT